MRLSIGDQNPKICKIIHDNTLIGINKISHMYTNTFNNCLVNVGESIA